jgi:2-iminobutanoate/2-iminopropanoate deaminase
VSKQIVRSEHVVEGMGPFSQCTRVGNLLFISGQVAWDREGKVVAPGDAAVQARQAFENMRNLLQAAGATMDDVVKINLYLTNIADSAAVRKVREEFFQPPYPAATSVEVSKLVLPELVVEVEAIAALGEAGQS